MLAARLCKASEYVVLDAEDEPPPATPGASADGAASGFDSITHTRLLACDVSAMRHARRHFVSTVE